MDVLLKNIEVNHEGCTACSACVSACPNHAVRLSRNKEGFLQAEIDAALCTDCGICRDVCHLNKIQPLRGNQMPVYYAGFSRDRENIEHSSSGGMFYELAKYFICRSGIVYGAVQQSVYEVFHQRGETLEDIKKFRRSKYLESDLKNCFKEIEKDLKQRKEVLFSGVGCQVAGLYGYLQKDYENLYTCEVVCHGIPSRLAYERYLRERNEQYHDEMCGINFRDKSHGWRENSICEYYTSGRSECINSSRHPLHSIYLKGINMRKTCGSCLYARLPRVADLTLADFWGYRGRLLEINPDRGVSLIAVNNDKGKRLLGQISKQVHLEKTEAAVALASCRHMAKSPVLYKSQTAFMQLIQNTAYHIAAELCSSFGPVIIERELYKIEKIQENKVLDIFWEDENSIIYLLDKSGKLDGIITYGDFIRNYTRKSRWVNYNFKRVIVSNEMIDEIQELFASNQNINRIPIVDEDGTLLYEVRRNGKKDGHFLDDRFIEVAKRYENIFDKQCPKVICDWRQAEEERDTGRRLLVCSPGRKAILSQKYCVDSICRTGYLEEMETVLPFLLLYNMGAAVYFVKRPDLLSEYDYTPEEKERIEGGLSFPKLSQDIEENEEVLKKIFHSKFSYPYISGLRRVPQIVEKNGRYQHVDYFSEYINVIGGYRKTCHQPKVYDNSVHVYGRCGAFGYAVEDSETIPSFLQQLFTKAGQNTRVVNHGLWGADDQKIIHNLVVDINEGILKSGDKIVIYMDYLPCMEQLKMLNVCVKDTTLPFHEFIKNKTVFYDRPGHMTAEGYRYMAGLIYHMISIAAICEKSSMGKKGKIDGFVPQYFEYLSENGNAHHDGNKAEIGKYLSEIEEKIPQWNNGKVRGAIVMNCNPFTKGHRYLIETAAKAVDELLIFVLEEDKSFFPFKDRFQMVKNGTGDLENVYVMPSGKFMISALTFPEYFIKEQQQDITINPLSDVMIFARDIAPRLHISVRFVGTEPMDKVTNQYNDTLREQLPLFGIKYVEVERLMSGGQVVTATEVRRMLKASDKEHLAELVPKTTYEYLKEKDYFERSYQGDGR